MAAYHLAVIIITFRQLNIKSIMKALIADDEPALRKHLRNRLEKLWPELEICAEAEDGDQALEAVQTLQPDIAFLDIRMPGLSGLEVAGRITGSCHIVFITAYDQYAIEAFKQHAADYLLKPIDDERLQDTIHRLKNLDPEAVDRTALNEALSRINSMLAQQNSEPLQWIRASKGDDIHMLHVDDVAFFQSGDKYTSARTAEREYLIRTPLKELEISLDSRDFWRIHRGVIVNIRWIDSAKRTQDGRYTLYLRGLNEELGVSRAYAHLFKQM